MTTFKSVAARKLTTALLFASFIFLAASAPRAVAQGRGDVIVSLVAQKVKVSAEGKEILQPAERAFPGEVIQYDALYHNQSATEIHNLAPTLPIPSGMEYLPEGATPAPAEASLDGKTFAPIPLKRKVTRPDGTVREEEVPASEYRALRWQMGDMAAGKKVTVAARARLLSATVAGR